MKKIWIYYLVCLLGFINQAQAENTPIEHPLPQSRNFTLTPPKGWERIADKAQLPTKVEVVYIGKGKRGFTPSLNLTTETTEMALAEYVELAKQYHESHPETRCHNLGSIETHAGKASLLQIDRKTQWGEVRFLQSLLIVDKQAYVLTATCLEEEFSNLSSSFLTAIKSLSIYSLPPSQESS